MDTPFVQPLAALTPREREVLGFAATGMTNGEMATQLSISVHAVKYHLAGIYRKLGVSNRTEAAFAYLRHADSLRAAGGEES
jgi:DNA-binding CsgD family transcriptional regulator